MLERLINIVLGKSRHRPSAGISIRRCADLADLELRELHAFANELLVEDFEHFRTHALTNDVVHVFRRRDTGAIVGFQFWRVLPMKLPRSVAILGGKLRVEPAFRNRGLHLLSGLVFFLSRILRHPLTRHYRLSVASIFGFVSLTSALRNYRLLEAGGESAEQRAVHEAFQRIAAENHFRLENGGALMFVDIFMSDGTLAGYPDNWYERASARRYAQVNPHFRDNGTFVNFWFRFTPGNLVATVGQLRRKLF